MANINRLYFVVIILIVIAVVEILIKWERSKMQNQSKDEQKVELSLVDSQARRDYNLFEEAVTTTFEIPPMLIEKAPEPYNVTLINADKMAETLRDFLREQSTEMGSLRTGVEKKLLEFYKHLDERHIEIDPSSYAEKRKRILLLTTHHSGSTFTGNLFDANAEVFYMYEPMQIVQFHDNWTLPRIHQNESNYHLNHMLNCEFAPTFRSSMKYYPDMNKQRGGWTNKCFKSKPLNWTYSDENLDKVADELKQQCLQNFTFTAIKSIRADTIASIIPLIVSGAKVIFLVRDPRGLGNSRFKKKIDIAQDRLVEHMAMECSKNHRNIEFLRKAQEIKSLHNLLMRNFRIIRYEDIAYSTLERCRDIFHFVGLKMTEEVRNWIILNTSFNTTLDVDDTQTTSDRSKAIASKWRLSLPYEVVRTLEDSCKLTMDELGFKVLKSKKEYADESIDLIDEIKNVPYTF